MSEVTPPYTDEQLLGEGVSKKDLVTFLQENASLQFQVERKLKGAAKNVVKTKTKEQLVDDYRHLFETKSFKKEGEEEVLPPTDVSASTASSKDTKANEVAHITEKTKKLDVKSQEPVKYTKKILKNGDKTSFPRKGDEVECYYTGKLDNGKVFDSNMEADKKGKKPPPLKFKVGVGKVIRGWDEALLTMTVGESAEIVIQPEWAYGKKGIEGNCCAKFSAAYGWKAKKPLFKYFSACWPELNFASQLDSMHFINNSLNSNKGHGTFLPDLL